MALTAVFRGEGSKKARRGEMPALGEVRQEGELELIQSAQKGDGDAFAHLVKGYESFLRSLVTLYLGSARQADIADVAQEIWTAVYRKLWQLEDGGKFLPWLRQVVYHQCLNYRQRRTRLAGHETLLSHEAWVRLVESVADEAGPLDEILESSELRRLLRDKMAGLPADYGRLLGLHYFEGMSYEEIAEVTGLPISTVRWRLHQGRSLLRSRLLTYMANTGGFYR